MSNNFKFLYKIFQKQTIYNVGSIFWYIFKEINCTSCRESRWDVIILKSYWNPINSMLLHICILWGNRKMGAIIWYNVFLSIIMTLKAKLYVVHLCYEYGFLVRVRVYFMKCWPRWFYPISLQVLQQVV